MSACCLQRSLAFLLILLLQGPAMLTQEVAWAQMLIRYTSERGLTRGVVETFDGKHPCDLCAKAAELRKGGEPAAPVEHRQKSMRLTWAEMLPGTITDLPVLAGRELPQLASQRMPEFSGRARDEPNSPPPEPS